MKYKVISAYTINGFTDIALDALKTDVPNFKVAKDSDGNLYEVLHPTFIRTHSVPPATFLLKGEFHGNEIELFN